MIRILDKQIADKIAAGEVIERPVSIIKELVENSIDAGADSIVVEIKKGGKAYIRVTDNGSGIARDEAERAFLRHATSKIETVKDLDAIETLGFRGEALASISAVTRTELLTKQADDKTGTRLIIHGGEVISNTPAGCPDGTTFVITDLFYNTPARLKFMKSDSAESTMIIDFMSQMALAYDNISFRLINNGNVLFSTTGKGDKLNVISRVFPNVDTKNLVPVDFEAEGLSLNGYISTPSMSRPSKNGQIFFVNGRVINSKVIERGINEGYRERLFEGRHPLAYLFLAVNAEALDVNIHPNKKEVRFDDEKAIEEFIASAIKSSLGTKEAVVRAGNIFKESLVSDSFDSELQDSVSHDSNLASVRDFAKANNDKSGQVDYKSILSTGTVSSVVKEEVLIPDVELPPAAAVISDEFKENTTHFETDEIELPPAVNKSRIGEAELLKELTETAQNTVISTASCNADVTLSIKKPLLQPFDFDDLLIKGAIFDTYITAVDGDNFYLIDQHAAHERIFYEKLVKEYENDEKLRQPLLFPLLIDVDISTKEGDEEWLELLDKMGYTIEAFGPNSYRITEIPTFMELSEAEDFVNDFIDSIGKNTDLRNSVVIDKIIMKSCKSAIKANDHLAPEEIDALIKDLKQCVNPFSCPHGRPTFIKLSKYEIERLFKRV